MYIFGYRSRASLSSKHLKQLNNGVFMTKIIVPGTGGLSTLNSRYPDVRKKSNIRNITLELSTTTTKKCNLFDLFVGKILFMLCLLVFDGKKRKVKDTGVVLWRKIGKQTTLDVNCKGVYRKINAWGNQ